MPMARLYLLVRRGGTVLVLSVPLRRIWAWSITAVFGVLGGGFLQSGNHLNQVYNMFPF